MEAGPVLFLKNVVMRWQLDSKNAFFASSVFLMALDTTRNVGEPRGAQPIKCHGWRPRAEKRVLEPGTDLAP